MHIYSGNCLRDTTSPPTPLQYLYGNVFAERVEGEVIEGRLAGLKVTLLKEQIGGSNVRSGERRKKVVKWIKLGYPAQQV